MALRNMPLPPELMSARQRQGKGGKPAPVDALGYRRLGADLPVGDVAEVLRRHLDPLPGCEDDPVAPGGLETVAGPDGGSERRVRYQDALGIDPLDDDEVPVADGVDQDDRWTADDRTLVKRHAQTVGLPPTAHPELRWTAGHGGNE